MWNLKKQNTVSKITPLLTAAAAAVLLCGCNTISNSFSQLFAVSEEETFAQERQFLADYERNKSLYKDARAETWVQPVNKKEKCKIYLGYDKANAEKALNADYYWDGACRDGFAYGIGREFTRSDGAVTEDLAEYKNPGQEPTYYYHKDKLQGMSVTGIFNSQVNTGQGYIYQENSSGFNYVQVAGVEDKEQNVTYLSTYDPITTTSRYVKQYPGFAYAFDFNSLNGTGTAYLMNTRTNEPAPYAYLYNNQGAHQGLRKAAPTAQVENVTLPESYWHRLMAVKQEIDAQLNQSTLTGRVNRGEMIKKEYIAKKCSARAAAPFASWPDYFDICREDKFIADIAEKVSAKIDERNAQLAAMAQQRQQQALIQAQIQAAEAQRNAAEAQQAVAALQQFNNQLNQMNQNTWNMINTVNQNNRQMMNTTVPNLVGNPNRGRITQCYVSSTGWVNCYN